MSGIWISGLAMCPWIHDRFLDSRWVLHPQEGGRLGIKSFASESVHDKVHDKVHDWYQDLGTKIFGGTGPG